MSKPVAKITKVIETMYTIIEEIGIPCMIRVSTDMKPFEIERMTMRLQPIIPASFGLSAKKRGSIFSSDSTLEF